jgi:hypothetical protein
MHCSCAAHEYGRALARPATVRSAGAVPSTIAATTRGETNARGATHLRGDRQTEGELFGLAEGAAQKRVIRRRLTADRAYQGMRSRRSATKRRRTVAVVMPSSASSIIGSAMWS